MLLTGYLHPEYPRSLREFGSPVQLPRSGGWILRRSIPEHDAFDGMGSYPCLICQDWSGLGADLEGLEKDIISFAAVTDPFGDYSLDDLRNVFPENMVFFKNHYVADLKQSPSDFVSAHHRRGAQKVLRDVEVEFHSCSERYLDEWFGLFACARERFKISGVRAFSREAFSKQLSLPGSFLSIARHRGEAVSAVIWLVAGDVAYSHVAASSEKGRALSADYALYFEEIKFFADKVRWLNWGGEAGIALNSPGRLSSFKKGWSTGTRPTYFCGRIFDHKAYHRITDSLGKHGADYFPKYRSGEFS